MYRATLFALTATLVKDGMVRSRESALETPGQIRELPVRLQLKLPHLLAHSHRVQPRRGARSRPQARRRGERCSSAEDAAATATAWVRVRALEGGGRRVSRPGRVRGHVEQRTGRGRRRRTPGRPACGGGPGIAHRRWSVRLRWRRRRCGRRCRWWRRRRLVLGRRRPWRRWRAAQG